MVAATLTTAERFAAPPDALRTGRWLFPRLTWADADTLVRTGIIPEDATTELLDGLIVLKDRSASGEDLVSIGNDHTTCVERSSDLRSEIKSPRRHVRSQQPVICSETHVPEPDFMVVRGTLGDYAGRPTAADAYCVVEVADSSYERDAGPKLVGYARAGVRQYVIVNLRTRTAEGYADPDPAAGTYPPPAVVGAGGVLALRVGEDEFFAVPLADVLP